MACLYLGSRNHSATGRLPQVVLDSKAMTRLILEASSNPGSWVLSRQGEILASGKLSGTVAASLIPSFQKELLDPTRPDQILIGVGPGSFSGIRSAIASAEGLAAVWRCPVLPVRSTGSIAWQFSQVTQLGVFSDARRGDVFATFYASGKLERPTAVHPVSELPRLLSRCTLAVTPDALTGVGQTALPDAATLAAHVHAHGLEPGLALEPIHLRPALKPA
ncbi:tRNA (adenosine(37)-N6)-threonylcarbamoyltransferase complex dimerization subunit type 1 TsaB [bacterium]|nr:tRNA (adenosine(37)-N6)-threonylcarbamoyltransferase complex dimerization subunit type 1 TsaB [bacterium]